MKAEAPLLPTPFGAALGLLLSLFVAPTVGGCERRAAPTPPTPPLDNRGAMMLAPLRHHAFRTEALLDQLKLDPTDVVADVGAGPGFFTLPLLRRLDPKRGGRVIATDLRADYLAVLTARAAEARLSHVETRVVAADAPGLEPHTIDLALLVQVDHLFGDRVGYLRALATSLKGGQRPGRIAVVNRIRFREAARAAAEEAGLAVLSEWTPTPPFFMLVLSRRGDAR